MREIFEHVLALINVVRDPKRIMSRGRTIGALNRRCRNTKRDLSHFEHVKVALNPTGVVNVEFAVGQVTTLELSVSQ